MCLLSLQEDVKDTVEKFLEYLMINHRVDREPASILQAFEISLVRNFFLSACPTFSLSSCF